MSDADFVAHLILIKSAAERVVEHIKTVQPCMDNIHHHYGLHCNNRASEDITELIWLLTDPNYKGGDVYK